MAFSLKTSGAWAETITDPTTCTLVGTPAAGDRYFLWVVWKAYDTTCQVISPQAWHEVIEFTDGAVAAGNNVGSVKVACYWRDWITGDGDPSIDWSAAPAPAVYVMQLWQKAANDSWEWPLFATNAWASSAGPATVAATTTTDVSNDAVTFLLAGIRDDTATFTRATTAISCADLTFNGNYVESPDAHISTTTSNDLSADLGHRFVTTGHLASTLSGSIDALSAAETGTLLWVVQNRPIGSGKAVRLANTCTVPFTTVTGNTMLIVAVAVGHANAGSYSTWNTRTATFNGDAMTSLGAVNTNNSTWGFVELFYLTPPDIGTYDIVVNMTKTAVTDYTIIVGAKAYSGPTMAGTPVTNYGSSTAPTVTVTSAATETVVAAILHGQPLSALSDNVVFRSNFDNGYDAAGNLAIVDRVGEASSVLSGTGASSDYWAAIAVALSGITNYNVDLTETVTATVTPGAGKGTGIAVTRSNTATITPAAGKGTNIGVTQSVTATIAPALTLGHTYTGAITETTTATVTTAAKTNQNAGMTQAVTATVTPALTLGQNADATTAVTADITPELTLGYALGLTETVNATVSPEAKTNQNASITQTVAATIEPAASVKTNWTADLTETVTATLTPAAAIGQNITTAEAVSAAITAAAQRGFIAGATVAALAEITPTATIGHALTAALTQTITAEVIPDAKTDQNAATTVAATAAIDTAAQVSQVGTSFIEIPVFAVIEPNARADFNTSASVSGAVDIDMVLVRGLQTQLSTETTATVEVSALTGHALSADVSESVNADIEASARGDFEATVTESAAATITAEACTDQRVTASITAAADIDVNASVSAPGTADITIDAAASIELAAQVTSQTGAATVVIATIGVSANVTKNSSVQYPVTATVSVAAVVDARAQTAIPIAATVSVEGTKHADLTAAVTAAAAISIDATVMNLGALLDIAHRYTVTIPATPEITIMADTIVIQIRTDIAATEVPVTNLEIPAVPVCLEIN